MANKKTSKKRIIKGKDFVTDKRQDGLRVSKRKGWRVSGSNRVPTKKEIQEHYDGLRSDIYMESRPNRSDFSTRAKKGERFEKGGKVDRAKSTKKTRVNRTKKAISQDKNIKALHAGKRISENNNVYWEGRENRSDKNRTKKLAKGGDLKNYTSADLPKDGSEIKIHMPEMGKFPAEDIVLKYNKDNFAFDAYRNGELSATRITEKQVLDNLNNGSYEFKEDSDEYAKGGEVGGRGFFGLEKGEEIKDLSKLEKGDVILTYSKQFNAENTLKIVDVRQSGNRVVYDAVYWNPKTDKQIGSEEMSITDINLEWNDYYFPLNYKKGGKLGFEGLAKKVAKEYEGDKVKPEYQDEYGKRYDKEEAKEVGQKVAAKVYREQQGMMEQGGEIKSELTLSEIESKLGKTFGFWDVPYEVKVDGVTYRKAFMGKTYRKI
jgi:hypothetical protein